MSAFFPSDFLRDLSLLDPCGQQVGLLTLSKATPAQAATGQDWPTWRMYSRSDRRVLRSAWLSALEWRHNHQTTPTLHCS